MVHATASGLAPTLISSVLFLFVFFLFRFILLYLCKVSNHPLHRQFIVIQVRTGFEEGWGEFF